MEQNIIDRIKSYEDACVELGLNPENLPIVDRLPQKDWISVIAYYKLTVITSALNEGWEPDWINHDQSKYFNWFYIEIYGANAGFGCAYTTSAASSTYTYIGSRLCFKDRRIAEYAREQFRDLYFEYLFIEMPKNYGK
jgi:hypothetical protein